MATQEVLITPASGKIEYKSASGGTVYSTIYDVDGDLYLVPYTAKTVTISGPVVISGNLTINGTTTTLNSTTISIDDKNIELGAVATPTDTTADGGGITLKGATDKTITWDNTNDNWTFNQAVNINSGLTYKINNVSVLSATGLGSTVVASSLTSVGTLTSLTVSGATALNGTVALGDAAADVITLNGTLASATGIKIYDSDSTTYTYTISPGNIGANTALTLPTTAGTFVITDQATGKVNLGSTTYVTGTLPVGNGGTGATTLTSTGVLVGNGTSAISAPGPTLTSTVFTFGGAGTINSTTTNALTLDSTTTGAINLGTNANAKTITIGNATGTTSVVVNSGTNGVTFNQVAAGIFKIQASAIPTTDMVQITNTGKATVTAGVNALNVTYVGGAAAVESSAIRTEMTPGGTSGGTWSSIRVINGASVTGVVTNGVKFDTKTAGTGTANVLWVGTGWDNILNYNGTTVINGTGKVIAGQLSGTIPSAVLGNSTLYVGTTSIALNRASASQALTGITSIDGSAATLTTTRTLWGQNFNGSANVTGALTNTGTITPASSGASDVGSSSLKYANSFFSGTTLSAIFQTGSGYMQWNATIGGIDFVC